MNTIQEATHFKLLAVDFLSLTIHNSPHSPPSFTRNGMPITRAQTVGVVVSVECIDNSLTFLVDDGSGCIPCILFLHPQPEHGLDLGVSVEMAHREATTVELGKLVRVRGKITLSPRGSLQLTVSNVLVEHHPNMELLHSLECISLAKHQNIGKDSVKEEARSQESSTTKESGNAMEIPTLKKEDQELSSSNKQNSHIEWPSSIALNILKAQSSETEETTSTSVPALAKLTNRLNLLRERRAKLANEVQNAQKNCTSAPVGPPQTGNSG